MSILDPGSGAVMLLNSSIVTLAPGMPEYLPAAMASLRATSALVTQGRVLSLLGTPDGGKVTIDGDDPQSDILYFKHSHPNIELSDGHQIDLASGNMHIGGLYVKNANDHSHGNSMVSLARMAKAAQYTNLKTISTGASRMQGGVSYGKLGVQDTGWKTWPKMGFDAPIGQATAPAAQRDLSWVRRPQRISDLIIRKKGAVWWKNNALRFYKNETIPVTFDLKKGSRSRYILSKELAKFNRKKPDVS